MLRLFLNLCREDGGPTLPQDLVEPRSNKFVFLFFFLFVCICHPQGATVISAVPFTITVGDTYALCDLDFETNLRKIDFAQVRQMIRKNLTPIDIFILFQLQVSCELFFTFSPGSSWFGLTRHTWSFFADIGFHLFVENH